MFDPYEVLGVARDASDEAIKDAYRTAASKAHPDRPGGSTEAMTDVNMAYRILSEPEQRAAYDQTGSTATITPVDALARELIIKSLQLIIRATSPFDDMIFIATQGLLKQREGCRAARQKTLEDLSHLRVRIQRLRGPVGNFIEGMLRLELERGEAILPTYDADERVIARAIDMLREFSYGGSIGLSRIIINSSVLGGPNG